MVAKLLLRKNKVLGLQNLLLMGPGPDQQQPPAVHTGGVSRGRIYDCGCWYLCNGTGDTQQVTQDS